MRNLISLTKWLNEKIKIFNARAKAIATLRDLSTLVSISLALIYDWNEGTAEQLADRAAQMSRVDRALSEVQNKECAAITNETNQKGAEAKATATEQFRLARERFNDAVAEAKRNNWRADILLGLQVLQTSLQIQALVERISNIASAAKANPSTSNDTASASTTPSSEQSPGSAGNRPTERRESTGTRSKVGVPTKGNVPTVRVADDVVINDARHIAEEAKCPSENFWNRGISCVQRR
jgi:hypothetical protein